MSLIMGEKMRKTEMSPPIKDHTLLLDFDPHSQRRRRGLVCYDQDTKTPTFRRQTPTPALTGVLPEDLTTTLVQHTQASIT